MGDKKDVPSWAKGNEYHVFFGSGGGLNKIRWKTLYATLVRRHCVEYMRCEPPFKRHFVRTKIVTEIQKRGGKFFEWDKKSKAWAETNDQDLLFRRISQALRDRNKPNKKPAAGRRRRPPSGKDATARPVPKNKGTDQDDEDADGGVEDDEGDDDRPPPISEVRIPTVPPPPSSSTATDDRRAGSMQPAPPRGVGDEPFGRDDYLNRGHEPFLGGGGNDPLFDDCKQPSSPFRRAAERADSDERDRPSPGIGTVQPIPFPPPPELRAAETFGSTFSALRFGTTATASFGGEVAAASAFDRATLATTDGRDGIPPSDGFGSPPYRKAQDRVGDGPKDLLDALQERQAKMNLIQASLSSGLVHAPDGRVDPIAWEGVRHALGCIDAGIQDLGASLGLRQQQRQQQQQQQQQPPPNQRQEQGLGQSASSPPGGSNDAPYEVGRHGKSDHRVSDAGGDSLASEALLVCAGI